MALLTMRAFTLGLAAAMPIEQSGVSEFGEEQFSRSVIVEGRHASTLAQKVTHYEVRLLGYALVRFVDVLDAILERFTFWWQQLSDLIEAGARSRLE